jgi:hypothetical protein
VILVSWPFVTRSEWFGNPDGLIFKRLVGGRGGDDKLGCSPFGVPAIRTKAVDSSSYPVGRIGGAETTLDSEVGGLLKSESFRPAVGHEFES